MSLVDFFGWRSRVATAALVAALLCGITRASDFRSGNALFHVETDEDGIKTFTLYKRPETPAALLPDVPKVLLKAASASDLAQTPEVGLEEALPKTWSKQESIENLEFRFAKVNHFNLQKTDGFLRALLEHRPDLAGLPFRMGMDCRMPEGRALELGEAIRAVRGAGDGLPELNDALYQPLVAALMQIHGPKEKQAELAKLLSTIPHVDATVALARLALFSADASAREHAALGLKVRRERDYTELLLQGLRYPWPPVARHAAEALVRLERKDLLPQFIEALEAPDPRLPNEKEGSWQVRELVRINHHRNCLLCHAPAHAKVLLKAPESDKAKILSDVSKISEQMEKVGGRDHLRAAMPLPNRSFDTESGYGRQREFDNILVRVDVTYLRQDFSMLLPVADAAPWPDFQRFDFLVRTRTLSAAEADAVSNRLRSESADAPSAYQRAALFGLRELTGLEASTPAAWRRLLKLPAP